MLRFTIKYGPLLKVNVLPSAHRVELVGEADNGSRAEWSCGDMDGDNINELMSSPIGGAEPDTDL